MRNDLSEHLAQLTGLDVIAATVIVGGRSGADKFVVTTRQGTRAFVKLVRPSAGKRAAKLLHRERTVLAQLPQGVYAPRLLEYGQHRDCHFIVTDYVSGFIRNRWERDAAVSALDGLLSMHRLLQAVHVQAPHIQQKRQRFCNFSRIEELKRYAQLPELESDWVRTALPLLTTLEQRGRESIISSTLIHCDLAPDNVLINEDRCPVFIDWGHAYLGNYLYDVASILLRIRSDGAWSGALDDLLADNMVDAGEDEVLTEMIVLATGQFLSQSAGEEQSPSESLFDERMRYSTSGIRWLMERFDA